MNVIDLDSRLVSLGEQTELFDNDIEHITLETVNDPVHSPKHYQVLPGVQHIDIRDALLNKIDATGELNSRQVDYWSRAFEYLSRFMEKGGKQDLEKAKWYLDRLVGSFE